MEPNIVKEFQSLIVGIVGFLGVIATLLVNAWLSRRQHTRQVEHDSTVMRVALRAELEAIRDVLRDWVNMFENPEASPRGFFLPFESMTDVYESMIERLGLLKEYEIRAVMLAYLPIRQIPQRLELLAKSELTAIEREEGFARKEGKYAAALRDFHVNCLAGIETALSVISV